MMFLLCPLNFLIILCFFLLGAKDINYSQVEKLVSILIICLITFIIFNFLASFIFIITGVGLSFGKSAIAHSN